MIARKNGKTIARVAAAAALIAGAAFAWQPAPAAAGTYGLWEDSDGNLWCGDSCGSGQKCCDIVVAEPA